MTLEEAQRVKKGDILIYRTLEFEGCWLHLVTGVPDPGNSSAVTTLMLDFDEVDSVMIEDMVEGPGDWELVSCS